VRPLLIRLGAVTAGVVALWIGGVLALNATLYSPSRFASDYLSLVAAGEWSAAAEFAGVSEVVDVLPLESARISDVTISGWQHVGENDVVVQVDFVLDGGPQRMLLGLTRASRTLGVFDRWEFSDSPLAELSAQVAGVPQVVINDVGVAPGTTVSALIPGRYEFSAETQWVESETETLDLTEVGQSARVTPAINPTTALEDEVRRALGEYLAECASRGVLQPASCPFGTTVTDRLEGIPTWTISVSPAVALALSRTGESAEVGAIGGVATVTGTIQSIFDGSLRPLNRDISFSISGVVTELDSDSPALRID